MSLSTRVLLALAAGIAVGLFLSTTDASVARAVVAAVEPVGTLFVNGIRMTVIPLVVASLVVGIATSSSGAVVARVGGRGIVVFVVLLVAAGLVGAVVSPPVLSRLTLNPAAVASVRASVASPAAAAGLGTSALQTPSQWLTSLVPSNPISAAVDGAMLPLIVFSMLLGLALVSLPEATRLSVIPLFRGIADAMLVLVRWLLVVAPIGVFALTLPLVARLGLAAIGALAAYVVLISVMTVVFSVFIVYPAAAFFGRISIGQFARAALPPQAVAFSSRSSLAALPALIDSANTRLGLPEEITGFLIPLATVVFRVGGVLGVTTGAVFIARLYGVAISPQQLATVVVTGVVTSFSIPGIPGGSIVAMAPVLASIGLPIEGLGILLGVDTIPDMFRTTANVTGQLAAAVIVGRRSAIQPAATPAVDASPV
ncbi:MAG: dicarboxylate/amino acid:cation symporter [Gemmatimonas sp.]|nr:dicarboxylate/amino acid:cation symporter [Gemmatimonadaceae bacterium]